MFERAQREELARLVARHTARDGETSTAIPFVSLLRAARPSALRRGVLEPSLCLIVQGKKQLTIGRTTHRYGAWSYSASAVDFPTTGQITGAPYLAVRVKLDVAELAELAAAQPAQRAAAGPAVFVAEADAAMIGCFLKLVQLVDEPALAPPVRRELAYRLLRSPHGALVYRSVKPAHLGVGRAVDWLRQHFDQPIDVDALARQSRMSVSALRHEFKAATALAPLQFQKQLRLQEARRLLLAGEVDAGTAAFRVGYQSPSQFSREYRRMFGAPPIRDVANHQELDP